MTRMLSHARFRFALHSAAMVAAAASLAACDAISAAAVHCEPAEPLATLPTAVDEASGIAFGAGDVYAWVHNDSEGSPLLYALDADGRLLAQIGLPAAGTQSDWEDIAAGPCPAGRCLYIADIGDNLHERDDIAILRVAEPDVAAMRDGGAVDRFPIAYPDGAEDAESLFVLPDTSLYIVTKGRQSPVTVYRYAAPLRDTALVLERVQQLTDGLVQVPDFVTAAAASPDGRTVAIRSYSRLRFYRPAGDSLQPLAPEAGIDLTPLGEPLGEGVALGDDGTVLLVSESGRGGVAGQVHRLKCRLPG